MTNLSSNFFSGGTLRVILQVLSHLIPKEFSKYSNISFYSSMKEEKHLWI